MKKIMPDIFEDIKKLVYKTINRKRAGLMLGLAELGVYNGLYIGAYHILASNYIILNKTPLYLLEEKSDDLIYAYIYHLLLHEYLHTLGIVDERLCIELTYEISKREFGDDHLITILAKGGMKKVFPEIIYAPINFKMSSDQKIELVRDFDRSSACYFS